MTAPSSAAKGTNITYTIIVTNLGPATGTGITVTDTLPKETAFKSATSTQGSCSTVRGKVTCTVGTLPSGSSATITIVAKAPNKAGTLSNAATVTAQESDPDATNNSKTAVTTVA